MNGRQAFSILAGIPCLLSFLIISCTKSGVADDRPYELSYGDSILYLSNQPGDQIIYPTEHRPGEYEGFPDGIEIDEETGAIDLSDSETGLRYRITHTAPNGTQTTTMVVLSGITYFDKFYMIGQGDTLAQPIYNASASRAVPTTGSIFDEGEFANAGGCAVKQGDGRINLAETIRNGVFGSVPRNDERRDFDIEYRLNDESGSAKNKLRVRLYWYATMNDVPADLWETLEEREQEGVFLGMAPSILHHSPGTARSQSTLRSTREARPRPPCIILVGQ